MVTSAVSPVNAATSTDAQLRALVARGFRFIDPRDEYGDVVAVVGIRAHHNVVDVVQLNSEDDVIASRMPSDQDVMAPRQVFWREVGPVQEVLGKMLAMADDWVPQLVLLHSA
jgi:hypothetical protein